MITAIFSSRSNNKIVDIPIAKEIADKYSKQCSLKEQVVDEKSIIIKRMNEPRFDFVSKLPKENGYPRCNDYCRIGVLHLAADEISTQKVEGVVAELGVYQGDFAKHISEVFNDRKLYLYDTFKGFDNDEFMYEVGKEYWKATWAKEHNMLKDTSIELVLSKMNKKDMCVIREGLFPDSVQEEDYSLKFSFVSIDVDLYLPTMAGLEFFYPRLSEGGYIMIHDYNGQGMKGVKQAVVDFEKKNGRMVKFAIPDNSGSLLISK